MIVVVTALIGPAESAPPVGPAEPGVRYVCYTDREAPGWECMAPVAGLPRYAARYAKTHVHELDADVTVWMDASFDLLVPPSRIVAAANDTGHNVAAFAHPDRSTMEEEAAEVMRLGLADVRAVDRQIQAYRRTAFPGRPLTTTGLLVRRHTPAVARFNERWWHEIASRTLRDQLSIDFAAWRMGIRIGYLPGHYRANAFVRYDRERHRQGRVPRMIWRDDDVGRHSRLEGLAAVDDMLREYGTRHTVAVIANEVRTKPPLIRLIRERRMDVQLHCWDHDDLTQSTLAREQLPAAVQVIEDLFGMRPTVLYPPWNRSSPEVEAAAAALGLSVSWQKISLAQYIRAGGDVAERVINLHYWAPEDVVLLERALRIATGKT